MVHFLKDGCKEEKMTNVWKENNFNAIEVFYFFLLVEKGNTLKRWSSF